MVIAEGKSEAISQPPRLIRLAIFARLFVWLVSKFILDCCASSNTACNDCISCILTTRGICNIALAISSQ